MHYRALSLLLGFAVATTTISQAQFNEYATSGDLQDPGAMLRSTISGVVTRADGTALNNIRIEVHAIGTGTLVGAVYSHVNGSFDIGNIREGTYELVAVDGASEAREQLHVHGQMMSVNLRMPGRATAPGSRRGMVSVAELRVPDKAKRLLEKAQSALAKGHADEAEDHVDDALQAAPDYAAALAFRAALKLTRNETQPALDDLDHAVKVDPTYPQTYVLLGAAFNHLGKYDEALRSLDRGTMYNPNSWQSAYEMSKSWMGKGDYAHALQQLNRAESLGASKVAGQLHLLKGYAFLGQKQFDKARTELEAYLTAEPEGKLAGSVRAALADIQTQMARSPAGVTLPTMTGFFAQAH